MTDPKTLHEISCQKCSTQNPPGRDYCVECGTSLWILCPSCRGRVAVTEKFCGRCGSNIKELRDKEEREVEDRIDRMKAATKIGDFGLAMQLCRAVCASDSQRFAEAVEFARGRMAELKELQAKAEERVTQSFRLAKHQISECEFEKAYETLSQIPEPLRTEEVTELLATAESRRNEIARLRAELPERVRSKPLEAFQDLALLVRLQPNELRMKKVGEQLRGQILKRAEERIAGQKFAEARELLRRIPAEFSNEKVTALQEQANEAVWFETTLKTTPFVDENLVACAQRFAQIASANATAKTWVEQAKKRWEDAKTRPPGVAPWAAANREPLVGKSINYFQPLKGFRAEGIKVSGGLPGLQRCSVALGLALQAIGETAIKPTFAQGKKGLISKLGLKGLRTPDQGWGIDIGTTAVKAVQLTRKGGEITVSDIRIVEIEPAAPHTRNDLEIRGLVRGALTKLRDDVELKGKPVMVSVDSSQVLARFIRFPSVADKKLEEIVEAEAKHVIPFPLEDVEWYWHRFGTMSDGAVPILVVATRKDVIEDRADLLRQLDFQVMGVQCDTVALFQLLQFQGKDADANQPSTRVLLDIGAESTQFVVLSDDRLWFRTMSHGGSRITMSIGRELRQTFQDAEKVKVQPFQQKQILPVARGLQGPLNELVSEIERSSSAATRADFATRAAEVNLTGGASRTFGLAKTLVFGVEEEPVESSD